MLQRAISLAGACAAVLTLAACSGGSSGSNNNSVDPNTPTNVVCDGQCTTADSFLTIDDVKKVIAQAIAEAQARQAQATIAVTDRVGNVLAVYRMGDPATRTMTIATELKADGTPLVFTGLEGISLPAPGVPANIDQLGAIAKAVTGSYLSSEGNAFSTRTANTIVQEHFYPRQLGVSAGPLFGVQFSQLGCSDFSQRFNGSGVSVGPKRSPLGLSADPGGFPLYKKGALVGGIGVIADGLYSIDKVINQTKPDQDLDEIIAWAATFGFGAIQEIRAENAAVINGLPLIYSDADDRSLMSTPGNAPAFDTIPGSIGALVAVQGYSQAQILAGTVFGTPASGIRPADPGMFTNPAFVFVDDANQNRFPFRAGSDAAVLGGVQPLQPAEVQTILDQAIGVALSARAGIRRFMPNNQSVRVSVHVVDSFGVDLGAVRALDAPVFGADVALQKARAAALFSSPTAAQFFNSLPPARYLTTVGAGAPNANRTVNLGDYVTTYRAFVNNPTALTGETFFSNRGFGSLARPFFPDGIERTTIPGPFSKPFGDWSVFSSGIQLDTVMNGVSQHVLVAASVLPLAADPTPGCAGVQLATDLSSVGQTLTGSDLTRAGNGFQIFAGSEPIVRTDPAGIDRLVGAVGVSGDGIDQDDMVGFLGLDRASKILAAASSNPPRHASPQNRIDALAPAGSPLQDSPTRYVQCPQNPFLGSDVQRVCEGK